MTRPFRALVAVLLALLAAHFLLGMITNFHAPIPSVLCPGRGSGHAKAYS
jgi:uncharacterized membrane protein YgaE (UPF0421/DUF939 family)